MPERNDPFSTPSRASDPVCELSPLAAPYRRSVPVTTISVSRLPHREQTSRADQSERVCELSMPGHRGRIRLGSIHTLVGGEGPPPTGARKKDDKPASPLPRTGSSNPFPSSRQSVSLRISPSFPEKPGFSASLGRQPCGRVGRDAQSPLPSRRGALVSLSGYIPVPQSCRMQFEVLTGAGRKRGRLPWG
jgi:hypothetical protein